MIYRNTHFQGTGSSKVPTMYTYVPRNCGYTVVVGRGFGRLLYNSFSSFVGGKEFHKQEGMPAKNLQDLLLPLKTKPET